MVITSEALNLLKVACNNRVIVEHFSLRYEFNTLPLDLCSHKDRVGILDVTSRTHFGTL